ncbi:hypothetical protein MTZ49_09665 [Entomomonas sp. E2T0]|uniref:CZB domain-containing protein n=1 Tax=Entomomonas sp. E2T0 TaxID=2930213 RepID=UPI00222845AF|nr:CZB domain-containing protein [Entomomonas sp. E2T0]UYZ82879.1 hypothetical protein MTZ49_09665 [Entomomonas sp. E2T0]
MSLEAWLEGLIKGKDEPLTVPKDKMMLNGLYIGDAIKSHIDWRENWFVAVLERRVGDYEFTKVTADNLCNVGQWIYSLGKKYEGMPEYELLKQKHAEFHMCAGKAVKLHKEGSLVNAMATAKGPLLDLSQEIGLSFIKLLKAAQEKGAA